MPVLTTLLESTTQRSVFSTVHFNAGKSSANITMGGGRGKERIKKIAKNLDKFYFPANRLPLPLYPSLSFQCAKIIKMSAALYVKFF